MINHEELYKNSPYAELKSTDGSARIRIYTYRYEFPQATNRDDADWYMNHISLSINGVSAGVDEPVIEARVLECLLKEVEGFRNLSTSEVDFSFTERDICFTLTRDHKLSEKIIFVKGELIDSELDSSNVHIHFEFITDCILIDNFIFGIKQIQKEYPSRYNLNIY